METTMYVPKDEIKYWDSILMKDNAKDLGLNNGVLAEWRIDFAEDVYAVLQVIMEKDGFPWCQMVWYDGGYEFDFSDIHYEMQGIYVCNDENYSIKVVGK